MTSQVSPNTTNNFDVLIVGGGPTGCAAALTLLNQTSFDVCVIEATDYTNTRIGESVSPSITTLMRYLGIENDFFACNYLPSYGIDAAWGTARILTRDFFFTGQGNGWNLNRKLFDNMMADAVRKRNGSIFTSAKIINQNKNGKLWCLTTLRNDGSKMKLYADFVIDASGKNASFARNLGTKWQVLDQLVGVAAIYKIKMIEDQSTTLVESTKNGWWYSTLLPDNKRIVVFMTDGDIAKKLGIKKAETWNEWLKKTLHIQKTVKGATRIEGPKIFPAYSHIIKKTDPVKWVPAGDAVASFDPLSSIGIGHAIVSGIEAARIAHNTIQSDGHLISKYLEKAFENFEQYLKNRSHFYSYEKRWKDSPFWKRRHTNPDLSFSAQAES
jgi:flavin-dependent dehydrogenase